MEDLQIFVQSYVVFENNIRKKCSTDYSDPPKEENALGSDVSLSMEQPWQRTDNRTSQGLQKNSPPREADQTGAPHISST